MLIIILITEKSVVKMSGKTILLVMKYQLQKSQDKIKLNYLPIKNQTGETKKKLTIILLQN